MHPTITSGGDHCAIYHLADHAVSFQLHQLRRRYTPSCASSMIGNVHQVTNSNAVMSHFVNQLFLLNCYNIICIQNTLAVVPHILIHLPCSALQATILSALRQSEQCNNEFIMAAACLEDAILGNDFCATYGTDLVPLQVFDPPLCCFYSRCYLHVPTTL